MPLTSGPIVIEGGCNCQAIRYRVDISEFSQRPLYPGGTKHGVRMPVICSDFCNDCRSATGSILPFWMLTSIDMVSVSIMPISSMTSTDGKLSQDLQRPPWKPAAEAFLAPEADTKTTLSFFASSANRRRSFCNRCGTMLAYQVFPTPDGWSNDWPVMLDIVLGTADREHLASDLKPERHLWWDRGIDWVKDLAMHGADHLLVHPSYDLDKVVDMERASRNAS